MFLPLCTFDFLPNNSKGCEQILIKNSGNVDNGTGNR